MASKALRPALAGIAAIIGSLIWPIGAATAQNIEMIIPARNFELKLRDPVPAPLRERGVIRAGLIRLPSDIFTSLPSQPVIIPIGNDRSVELVEQRRRTVSDGKIYVIGAESSMPNSRFVMQLKNNELFRGEIRLDKEIISLTAPRPDNNDLIFRLLAIDPTVIPDEEESIDPKLPNLSIGGGGLLRRDEAEAPLSGPDVESDQGDRPGQAGAAAIEVKLMVVYTQAANELAELLWGVPIGDTISWAVDLANFGYEDQGGMTLSLVHTEQMPYTETGDIAEDIERLSCPCDHRMDNVGSNHLNQVFGPWKSKNADVVSLWIASPNFKDSGIAYAMPAVTTDFAPYSVSVVDVEAATYGYTFDHEIGHNFGARHDRAQATLFGMPYNYNHGFVNLDARQVTMMAYTKTCDSFAYDCIRVPIWSDPSYLPAGDWGVAAGEFAADNARTLFSSAPTVAAFNTKQNLVGCCVNVGTWWNKKWRPAACPN